MNKTTSKLSTHKLSLLSLLLLFCLFHSENTFSRDHWRADFVKVTYDTPNKAILLKCKVFDYIFGPGVENGYLECGDFEYSSDGINFTHLFRCDVRDQKKENWTWMTLRFKKFGEKIQFLNCYKPEDGSFWTDANTEPRVEVYSADRYDDNASQYSAFLSLKWTPGLDNQDVNYIRLKGFWKINGSYTGDQINQVYKVKKYKFEPDPDDDNSSSSKAQVHTNLSQSNTCTVYTAADFVVIKGVEVGTNIKIYTVTGAEIKSIVANNDVVKVKLPAKQKYIVNVGQARYKVAL